MKKNHLITLILLILGASLGIFCWKITHTPEYFAEKISGLDFGKDSYSVIHTDDRSFILDGGVICGEVILSKRHIPALLQQAVTNGYVHTDSLGRHPGLMAVTQNRCCDEKNKSINQHEGFYKIIQEDPRETTYLVIDTISQRLYYFKVRSSGIF